MSLKSKPWSKGQIEFHIEAGKKISLIKNEVKDFIFKNETKLYETDVIKFVKNLYKKYGLVNDSKKEFCIVAFGKNTNQVHYFPKGKGLKLKNNTLILLDIWVRLDKKDAPYADVTFMFYKGRIVPNKIQKTWKVLVRARDAALNFLQKKMQQKLKRSILPRGFEVDRASHDIIGNAGLGRGIKHTIGHSLGLKHPHGELPGINWREYSPLLKNIGYTIEPGIYLGKFGMRTEIDFYISEKNKLTVTTPIQKEIEII